MKTRKQPLEALLLGSSPFPLTSSFLTTVASALPKQINRLPDGEPGIRQNFMTWQRTKLPLSII